MRKELQTAESMIRTVDRLKSPQQYLQMGQQQQMGGQLYSPQSSQQRQLQQYGLLPVYSSTGFAIPPIPYVFHFG